MQRPSIRGPITLLALMSLSFGACRGEPTPPLFTGDLTRPEKEVEKEPAKIAEPERKLWFSSGPGRDAILARERQNFPAATKLLDEVLQDGSLAADDRGAALWLRALEDLRAQRFAEAAARLAEARAAPGLAAVAPRIRLLEAQAWLDAGMPEKAGAPLAGLVEAAAGTAIEAAATITSADAKARTNDRAGALAQYAAFIAKYPESPRRHEVRAKRARLLAESEAPEELREAIELYEKLLLDVPLSDYGSEAEERLPALAQKVGLRRSFAEDREAARQRTLAKIRDEQTRGRYAAVIRDVDDFLALQPPEADRCEALFLKGTAIFKQRKRAKSRSVFEQAAASCRKAGPGRKDTLVKALYQAGRGRYAEGEYERAAKQFQAVADEFPDHSYADDSLLLAGESWAEKGDKPRERQAYEGMLERFSGGDMAFEARRRLLVLALTQDRPADALKLADDGLTQKGLDLRERAKLHYFRGRGLHRLGRADDAVAAWLDVVATAPLSYPGLQAMSRLREAGDEPLARAIAALEKSADQAAVRLDLPPTPAAQRALLLARLGLGDEAREELSDAKIDGWPAAAVLAQAGLYGESQRLLGALGSGWRQSPPVGQNRELWTIAHPLAFSDLVRAGEGAHQVPWFLTFAIMQTESRFEPGVTSWAGARGLVQLMPATAKDLARQAGVDGFNDARLFDPSLNLDLGTLYLGNLVRRFGGEESAVPLAIPSYNAGAGAVDKWLDKRKDWDFDLFIEAIPYDETRAYTQSVLERWLSYRWLHAPAELTAAQRLPYVPLTLPSRARGVQAGPVDHG
ncbi:lytic transglycosylase domain-containing protein [Nannocystis radixulma]|uniref:Transglycosylase SLT domain-containing protein n=1 Tax=Nannocystis radixulma TaxID=2995305 RepID=A0ABT5BBE6_9BACT|nr:transglycosylase SLT domain-containing protein [Nannocystis radixulma]MDC0671461.1 transglycosylase SLT domain-containing protein [Nannocystis radixulma]